MLTFNQAKVLVEAETFFFFFPFSKSCECLFLESKSIIWKSENSWYIWGTAIIIAFLTLSSCMGILVHASAKYGTYISLRLETRLTFITMCTYVLPKDKYIFLEHTQKSLLFSQVKAIHAVRNVKFCIYMEPFRCERKEY